MKLPIPSFGKKTKQKYILALLLRDEKISALITEEVEGKMRIVGKQEEILTTPLEKLTEEEWLDTLDRTISKAEETLPPDRETHDTVFGVKESWVEDKKIKKDYLLQLKKISEALDLTPIGFLVISEAITHLIQAEEGAPVSAILVDIGKLSVTATLVRGGKVLDSQSVRREESLPQDVDTALKHFRSVDVFPSRVILFSGSSPVGERENSEHLAQQFISHHWSKSLPFLHAPQISILNGGFDAKAVVQGAASQMGFEVLNLTQSNNEIQNFDAHDKLPTKKTGKHEEDADEAEETKKSPGDEKTEEASQDEMPTDEDFGFIIDQDVSERPTIVQDNFKEVTPVSDHEEKKPHHEVKHHTADEHPAHEPRQAIVQTPPDGYYDEEATEASLEQEFERETGQKASPLAKIMAMVPAVSEITKKLPLKGLSLPQALSGGNKKLLIIPLAALVLLALSYYLYTANLKAEVTIFLKPNNVSESAEVLFSSESGNDFSEKTIAAKTVSTEIEGTLSADATGKKDIGEKAKGTVTVYNNDNARKTIGSGTTIATDKGLKFTVDKDVTIASASGDIFSGTKPGTAQVAVTASEFGSDYNLPSGTKFNVSGASNIAAKNDSAFSGGTKKQVTVVSKKDQDKLIADLSKSLQEKALGELEAKVSDDQQLLKFLTQATVSERKFDRKVDDEAKKVTLAGTVSFEALTFSEKDLKDFAEVTLKNTYNDNLHLSEKGVSFTVSDEKQKDEGVVEARLTIDAGLVPEIDTDSLTEQIEGKSVSEAEATLKKLPQVAKTEIKLSPSLPLLPGFLPKGEKRIQIKTALDE